MGQFLQSREEHRSKVQGEVDKKHLLPSPILLICLLGTRTNGDICIQNEPMRPGSRIVIRSFQKDTFVKGHTIDDAFAFRGHGTLWIANKYDIITLTIQQKLQ